MTKVISNELLAQKLDFALDKIAQVDKKVDGVNLKLDEHYITKDYFELRMQPVEQSRKIVFAFITAILIAFAGSLIGLVILKP